MPPVPTTSLAESDAPNYRAADAKAVERCVDCRFGSSYDGCRLYAIARPTYKPWFVCDSFEAMAMLYAEARTPSVAFAEPGKKEDDGSVWIEILKTGEFHSSRVGGGPSSGPKVVKIDKAMLASVAAGFEAAVADGQYPLGLPVRLDPDHSDPNGPAVGRGHEMRVSDDGEHLLLRTAWDDEVADGIKRKMWGSVSIEMDPPHLAQSKTTGAPIGEWTPTALVITDKPYIHGMAPLAASERAATKGHDMDLKLIRSTLALSESTDEAAVIAHLTELRATAAKVPVLQTTLDKTTVERDEATASVTKLTEEREQRILDDACAAGRISAAERKEYLDAERLMGADFVAKHYPANRIKVESKAGVQPPPKSEPVALTESAVVDEIRALSADLVKGGMTAPEAFILASERVMADPNKAAALGRSAEA